MIIEDYVSFETAKLLKEKGFAFDAQISSVKKIIICVLEVRNFRS